MTLAEYLSKICAGTASWNSRVVYNRSGVRRLRVCGLGLGPWGSRLRGLGTKGKMGLGIRAYDFHYKAVSAKNEAFARFFMTGGGDVHTANLRVLGCIKGIRCLNLHPINP